MNSIFRFVAATLAFSSSIRAEDFEFDAQVIKAIGENEIYYEIETNQILNNNQSEIILDHLGRSERLQRIVEDHLEDDRLHEDWLNSTASEDDYPVRRHRHRSRKLDAAWTKAPTAFPTHAPANCPATGGDPDQVHPPKCGTIYRGDESDLLLGPYKTSSYHRSSDAFSGNNGKRNIFRSHSYFPSYMYHISLNERCEYQTRKPENDHKWINHHTVNEWIDQAAMLYQRYGHQGYRVSDPDIIFSGWKVPDYFNEVIDEGIEDCPEEYCVKVIGRSLARRSLGSLYPGPDEEYTGEDLEIMWAFSNYWGHRDFKWFIRRIMTDDRAEEIFFTNHFWRCGQESFCKDEDCPTDDVHVGATCYVEHQCGETVYKVAYADNYPQNEKATWASTGTREPMLWFDECAFAMYDCVQFHVEEGSTFTGSRFDHRDNFKSFPDVKKYDEYEGQKFVYGLHGNKYQGFRKNRHDNPQPQMAWSCPSRDHMDQLEIFGDFVGKAEYMRYANLGRSVTPLPCEDDVSPPVGLSLPPPSGPSCDDIEDTVYCWELTQATCYAKLKEETETSCGEADLFLENSTGIFIFDDASLWNDGCLASAGEGCQRVPEWSHMEGHLTGKGFPLGIPHFSSHIGWELLLFNWARAPNEVGVDTITGNHKIIWYDCPNWEATYMGRNFTDGAGNRHEFWGNTFGDLYKDRDCTESPSDVPTEAPTMTLLPSDTPSLSPTFCGESYLTSENLNIALAIDTSYSTYEKEFSREVDIGDVNGDGKGNTILDAQVAAIQDLLDNIAMSDTLTNSNSEIELISFDTNAKSHGVWNPLSISDDSPNPELMEHIKQEMRTPTSGDEVRATNNGFTNFDAALDVAVEYFQQTATPNRKNLLVFLSDGEPNVRGDGDNEGYCADTVKFWNGDGSDVVCADLNLAPGQAHTNCLGDDAECAESDKYQDCVRGPNDCMNAAAVTNYTSEINALIELDVERLAIGVGNESNIAWGSALWTIDNNPAKYKGVLPLQALSLEELSEYLSNLCILNTEPPTASPSHSPSDSPTISSAPSSRPSALPTGTPSLSPTGSPTSSPTGVPTPSPSSSPTSAPTKVPTPTETPSSSPSGMYDLVGKDLKCPYQSPDRFIKDSKVESLEACYELCYNFPGCNYFSYKPNTCIICGLEDEGQLDEFRFYDTYKVNHQKSMEEFGYKLWNHGVGEVRGQDRKCPTDDRIPPDTTMSETRDECYDLCQSTPDCKWFTWGENHASENHAGKCMMCSSDELLEDHKGLYTFTMLNPAEPTSSLEKMSEPEPEPEEVEEPVIASTGAPTGPPTVSPTLRPTTSAPTVNPTAAHTASPTSMPTASPTTPPTPRPTTKPPTAAPSPSPSDMPSDGPSLEQSSTPTAQPQQKIVQQGADETPDDIFFDDVGQNECPEDVRLLDLHGYTQYPKTTVRIISQDTTNVTVAIVQKMTDSSSTVDNVFYQYSQSAFRSDCLEQQDVPGDETVEIITIHCMVSKPYAVLDIWIADDLEKGALTNGDDVVVPKCCHPDLPEGTPVVKYTMEIHCVSQCPEIVE